jgi:acyl-coenzyme A synthetase/AMP-(fatty) acid ligase
MNGHQKSFTRPGLSLTAGQGDARSLPELIDFHARVNPHHRFCIQAQKDADAPSLDVTYAKLKQLILRCQSWLCEHVADMRVENDTKGEPVGLFMDSDLTLVIYIFALMGLGVPAVLLSTRLSAEAVRHLLQRTRTSAIIASRRLDGIVAEALELWETDDSPPSRHSPASYKTFWADEGCPSFAQSDIGHPNHFLSESDCNVLILHSSGTTGLPKPIYTSHRHYFSFALCHEFTTDEQMLSPMLSTSPLFHVGDSSIARHCWTHADSENTGVRLAPALPVVGHRKTVLPPGDRYRLDWLVDSAFAAE